MLRAGWTFKDNVSLSGSAIAVLLNARHPRTLAIIVLMNRIPARKFALIFFTAACPGCGADKAIAPPPFSGQIEIRYASDITPALQEAATIAAAKWTRALSKNMGDFQLASPANECFVGEPALNETHHNLLLFVSLLPVDHQGGALAFTEVCKLSTRDTLPIVSHIRVDREDLDSLEARGELQGVIMHEMGHALGFNPLSYLPKELAEGTSEDPIFVGAGARSEFSKHGAWYTGPTVPLENVSNLGLRDPHWRFSVFGDELMSPSIGRGFKSPLSTITLGAFQDLGYTVDFSVADPYEVVPLFGGNRVVPEGSLSNDIVRNKPPTFVRPQVSR
jgi:hypothetical protein